MSRMPPSFRGGLPWAWAAPAATTSTAAKIPEKTRFIEASLHTGRIACSRHFGCGNHAASDRQRQGAAEPRDARFSAKRNEPFMRTWCHALVRDTDRIL